MSAVLPEVEAPTRDGGATIAENPTTRRSVARWSRSPPPSGRPGAAATARTRPTRHAVRRRRRLREQANVTPGSGCRQQPRHRPVLEGPPAVHRVQLLGSRPLHPCAPRALPDAGRQKRRPARLHDRLSGRRQCRPVAKLVATTSTNRWPAAHTCGRVPNADLQVPGADGRPRTPRKSLTRKRSQVQVLYRPPLLAQVSDCCFVPTGPAAPSTGRRSVQVRCPRSRSFGVGTAHPVGVVRCRETRVLAAPSTSGARSPRPTCRRSPASPRMRRSTSRGWPWWRARTTTGTPPGRGSPSASC